MILDMTKEIVESIESIQEVMSWVHKKHGQPNISANKLPTANYPAISIYERTNKPGTFADDDEISSIIGYQINLFSKDGSHHKVANKVHEMMKFKGFTRISSPTAFDEENNIIMKTMIYEQEIGTEDY